MKILVITPYLPWPLKTGGNAAMFSTLKCLAGDHQFTLICPIVKKQLNDVDYLETELPQLNLRPILIDSCSSPQSLRGRIAEAAKGILRSAEPQCPLEEPWDPFGPIPRIFAEAIDEEVSRGQDLCQVEFIEMVSVAALLPESLPKLFVHHQIHFIYNRLTWKAWQESAYLRYLLGRQYTTEIGYLQRYDAVITFSEDDKEILQAAKCLPPVFISPFPVPADLGIIETVPSGFSGIFCFLGSEEHPPNREGLTWLLDVLWPSISSKVGNAKLLIFGTWGPEWKKKAGVVEGKIHFPGFVNDLKHALRGGILLVPLRVGSGIRTKILAALSQGMPCVATTVAAEGLPTGEEGGVIRADSDSKFIDAAVRLATSAEAWNMCASSGPDYIQRFHSPEVVRARRNKIYRDVITAYKFKKVIQ